MLPKVERPTSVCRLLSNDEEVELQAQTMLGEKSLATAKESGKGTDILIAICSILQSSLIRPENLVIRNLPIFDVTKLFVVLRSMSKGSNMPLRYKCKCGRKFDVEVNLEDIEYGKVPERKLIVVNDTIKIKPKFPPISSIISLLEAIEAEDKELENKRTIELYASCIDKVYQGDEVYSTEDMSFKEVYDWFIELPEKVLNDLEKFVSDIPETKLTVTAQCSCGNEHTFTYTELKDFFVLPS